MLVNSKLNYSFNVTSINRDYKGVMSSGEVKGEQWIGNDIAGSDRGLIWGSLCLQFAKTAEMNRFKFICIVGLGAKILTCHPLIAVHSITEIFSNETLYERIAQS